MSQKWTCAVLLLAAWMLGTTLAAPPPSKVKDDPEVKKLLLKRRDVLRLSVAANKELFEAGRIAPTDLIRTMEKRLDVETELGTTGEERIKLLTEILRLAASVDATMTQRYEVGRSTVMDHLEARDFRLKCEIDLRKAGGKPPEDIPPAKATKTINE